MKGIDQVVQKENQSTEYHGAHAGTRLGVSDYGDGVNSTHYLGNDDYPNCNNVPDAFSCGDSKIIDLDGKVAYGNDVKEPHQ